MLISQEKHPELYRQISDANLLRQYDYLNATIKVSLAIQEYPITVELLCDLNKHAVEYISSHPGVIRKCPIYINNSHHSPPDHIYVNGHLVDCFKYIAENWSSKEAVHLASYALWKVNWVHPFVEGNGRTARAFSYFVLCAKLGMLLPGKNIIPQQIRANRDSYYKALASADASHNIGKLDVSELEGYLSDLLTKQLSDA